MTTRRKLLCSLFGAAGAIAYPCWLEPRGLELTRRRATLSRARLADPIRVLHLSDFHASVYVSLSMIEDGIALGLSEKPDLICVTGDFISHIDVPDAAAYARTLRRLT